LVSFLRDRQRQKFPRLLSYNLIFFPTLFLFFTDPVTTLLMMPKAHKQKRSGSPRPQQPGASKSILKQQTLLESTQSKKKSNELSVSDPPDDDDDWPSLSATSATPMDIATPVPDPKTPHIEPMQVEKAPSVLGNSCSEPPAQKLVVSATVITPPALTTPKASVGFASSNTVMEDSPDDNMVAVVRKQLAPVFSSTLVRKKTLFLKICLSVDPKPKDPTAAGRLQL
jgi:hypothetical protein